MPIVYIIIYVIIMFYLEEQEQNQIQNPMVYGSIYSFTIDEWGWYMMVSHWYPCFILIFALGTPQINPNDQTWIPMW